MNNSYDVKALAPGAWAIEMEKVRAFLVAGDTSALLIDTGAGGVNPARGGMRMHRAAAARGQHPLAL